MIDAVDYYGNLSIGLLFIAFMIVAMCYAVKELTK